MESSLFLESETPAKDLHVEPRGDLHGERLGVEKLISWAREKLHEEWLASKDNSSLCVMLMKMAI